ncbi:hypothetical protein F5B22DRAFT_652090 [Xylaria bambusicola]|uniref:uncharacterized protein n=1 Tax=Xylaria bambusicola TaxID=326684 RepID=UPI00200753F4|nr:uncharacterized protein F5B22DRAFT_652090 [Xylaria bambusicola]KAI0503377.1 hypothetical protein F5B22DRAFT_652090 [Xylaria bambusicola]
MKLIAIAPAFFAALTVADQVWPLELDYDYSIPTFSASKDITLTWKKGYFSYNLGNDYTPKYFTLLVAAYNNTPTGYYTDWSGHEQPLYEAVTAVEIDTKAKTNAFSYVWKPKFVNGWKGDGYWYLFLTKWVATNGIPESAGSKLFYLTD